MAVRVDPSTIAELLLEMDAAPGGSRMLLARSMLAPLTAELIDAATRLAQCLRSSVEVRVLGPPIIREIIYRALCGGRGAALRALATPQSNFGQIARALRRIHFDYAQTLDVGTLRAKPA